MHTSSFVSETAGAGFKNVYNYLGMQELQNATNIFNKRITGQKGLTFVTCFLSLP